MPTFKKDDQKILHISIPKTGSSSISKMFRVAGWVLEYDHPHAFYKDEPQDFDYGFTIVRHPVRRLLSAWHHGIEWGRHPLPLRKYWEQVNDSRPDTWEEFVLELPNRYKQDPRCDKHHLVPQAELIGSGLTDPRIEVFRFEDQGIEKIANKFGLKVLHKNKSRSVSEYCFLTPEMKSVIYELYSDDFKVFSYDFC